MLTSDIHQLSDRLEVLGKAIAEDLARFVTNPSEQYNLKYFETIGECAVEVLLLARELKVYLGTSSGVKQ